jgi:hypothetical protein
MSESVAVVATAQQQPNNRPVRGTLRIDIGTSSPILEAGRPFSILITLQNPFDVPVEITAVTAVAPVEFIDMGREQFERERDNAIRTLLAAATETPEDISKVKRKGADIWKAVWHLASKMVPGLSLFGEIYDVGRVIIASSISAPTPADVGVSVGRIKTEIEKAAATPEEGKKTAYEHLQAVVREEIIKREQRFSSTLLNPGNSVVQVFTMRTTKSLFFPPSTYEIPIQIEYRIAGTVDQDSVKYRLSIRSPLSATITGSIFGSVAGFLLRDIFEEKAILTILNGGGFAPFLVWFVALLGNVILAIVVVVAFARKRDTQPFISVEDFWGGLFVGAVAGYTGKAMVHDILASKLPNAK